MSLSVSWLQLFPEQLLADIWVSSPQGSTFKHVEDYISTLWLILYSLPQMLVNIFFLSSFFPLTQELFQNPNLNYLFWTLNSTHTYNWLKTAGYVYPVLREIQPSPHPS